MLPPLRQQRHEECGSGGGGEGKKGMVDSRDGQRGRRVENAVRRKTRKRRKERLRRKWACRSPYVTGKGLLQIEIGEPAVEKCRGMGGLFSGHFQARARSGSVDAEAARDAEQYFA